LAPAQSFALAPAQGFALPPAHGVALPPAQVHSFAATPQAADLRAAAQFMSKLADSLPATSQTTPPASAQAMSQDCCDRLTREVTAINQRLDQLQNIILKL